MTVKEYARLHDIAPSTVRSRCARGQISGAYLEDRDPDQGHGQIWVIPEENSETAEDPPENSLVIPQTVTVEKEDQCLEKIEAPPAVEQRPKQETDGGQNTAKGESKTWIWILVLLVLLGMRRSGNESPEWSRV